MKKVLYILVFIVFITGLFSCNNSVINDLIENKITAKSRLDSAYAQASRTYSPSVKLVMIFGKNVLFTGTDAGKTDITLTSGINDPNNIGAWLYIFKKPGTTDLAVYTPDPTPGSKNCLELTTLFNTNTILALIADTSAKNIVSGALGMITQSNFQISTSKDSLSDSDASFGFSYSSNPIIKFNSNFTPTSSTYNGNAFFSTSGYSNKTVNMFLIPALGTLQLNMPQYIQSLIGFPQDLWIVNYKADYSGSTQNFIVGTVVRGDQRMGINIISGLFSKAINLSKY